MYWFTYGPRPVRSHYSAIASIQTQRWYMLDGTAESMTIYEIEGGSWLFFDDVEAVPIGTASLIDNVFSYSTESYTGKMDLVRLF